MGMTDKSTDLRERLAARGAAYKVTDFEADRRGVEDRYTEWEGRGASWVYHEAIRDGLTTYTKLSHQACIDPEQAVAVTLGPVADAATSDGYHTFGELYDQRAVLLLAFSNFAYAFSLDAGCPRDEVAQQLFKSRCHHDGERPEGFFLVGINCALELGDPPLWATWHVEDKWWDSFEVPELERAPEWDGHTSKDALDRMVAAFTVAKEGGER